MWKYLFLSILLVGCGAPFQKANAQVQELEQLALDIEKLSQFKAILQDMYKYYQILTAGYNEVKSLAEGNFNLHNAFLNSLLTVSPSVKSYVRVADIISAQISLIAEYKSAQTQFQSAHVFSVTELDYIATVYSNLVNGSLDNLDKLVDILTDGKLRMSDAERLASIDGLYTDMQGKVSFLRAFNSKNNALLAQRQNALQENATLQSLYGTKN